MYKYRTSVPFMSRHHVFQSSLYCSVYYLNRPLRYFKVLRYEHVLRLDMPLCMEHIQSHTSVHFLACPIVRVKAGETAWLSGCRNFERAAELYRWSRLRTSRRRGCISADFATNTSGWRSFFWSWDALRIAGGEHDDRDQARRGVLAQLPEEREAIEARHDAVGDDEVGRAAMDLVEPLEAVGGRHERRPVLLRRPSAGDTRRWGCRRRPARARPTGGVRF